MKADNHIKAPAERSQNPVRPVLLRFKNVRRSQPVAILKPTRRLGFDMPMHHAETTARHNHRVGEVCRYRLTEWVVERFCQRPKVCAHGDRPQDYSVSTRLALKPVSSPGYPLGLQTTRVPATS